MKKVLTTTAVLEAATSLAMLVLPSLTVSLILGASLNTAVAFAVTRVGGVAILALGVACWMAQNDEHSRDTRGLVGSMVFHKAPPRMRLAFLPKSIPESVRFWYARRCPLYDLSLFK